MSGTTQPIARSAPGRSPSARISIAEAAEGYGVTTRTIRRWIAAGILTGYRVGPTLIRLDAEEVQALARRIPAARHRSREGADITSTSI